MQLQINNGMVEVVITGIQKNVATNIWNGPIGTETWEYTYKLTFCKFDDLNEKKKIEKGNVVIEYDSDSNIITIKFRDRNINGFDIDKIEYDSKKVGSESNTTITTIYDKNKTEIDGHLWTLFILISSATFKFNKDNKCFYFEKMFERRTETSTKRFLVTPYNYP